MARKMEKITDECTYLIDDGAGASASGAEKMKHPTSENMDVEIAGGFRFRPTSNLNVTNISDVTNEMNKLAMSPPDNSLRISERNEPCTSRSLLYNPVPRTPNDDRNNLNRGRRDFESRKRDYEFCGSSGGSFMHNQQDGERSEKKLSRKEREWLAEGKTLEPIVTVFGPNHFKFYDTGYQGQGPLIELEDNEGFVSGLRDGEEIPKRELTPLERTLLRERKTEEGLD